jgi:hypothetical protein
VWTSNTHHSQSACTDLTNIKYHTATLCIYSTAYMRPRTFESALITAIWTVWEHVQICVDFVHSLRSLSTIMWPPLWSSGQSSWLQIQGSRVRFPGTTKKNSGSGTGSTQPRKYNWGATWYKSSGSCLENREYGRRDPSRWPRGTLYPQTLAITSPTSGGRSVGIVRSRTQTMEFSFFYFSSAHVTSGQKATEVHLQGYERSVRKCN